MGAGLGLGMGMRMAQAFGPTGNVAPSTINCPSCGKAIPAGSKFCSDCGTRIVTNCPQCGKKVEPGTRFCPECGTKLI